MIRYSSFASVRQLLLLVCFAGLSKHYRAQILALDSVDTKELSGYDVYFIGEEHRHNYLAQAQIKLINLIQAGDSAVLLLESDVCANFILHEVMVKKDTSRYTFKDLNYTKPELFRYLYYSNLPVKAIDEVRFKTTWKEFLLQEGFNYEKADTLLKTRLDRLMQIGPIRFPNRKKNMKLYINFIKYYKANLHFFNRYASDSALCLDIIKGVETNILSVYARYWKYKFMSKHREKFIFNHVAKEIISGAGHKVISIFGWAHVVLKKQVFDIQRFGRKLEVISVASMAKDSFPDKKIASIYIWNRKVDKLGPKKDFPKDSRYIIEHTNPNVKYLIKIDYPGSPFKELQGIFTHLLIL